MSSILSQTQTTANIQKSLELFAEENSLSLTECDFTILKTKTYVKSNASSEFQQFDAKTLKEYMEKEKILNEHVEFLQRHEINIFQCQDDNPIQLHYKIVFDAYNSEPAIILFPDSIIPYTQYKPQELLNLLYIELNKIKALAGILIRMFDEEMIQRLKLLTKYIYTQKFTKRVRFNIFQGIEPTIAKQSKVIYWFQQKKNENQVIEVEENELLIEYVKPVFGSNGLNAFGDIVSTDYFKNTHDIDAEIDSESIYIEDGVDSKRYIAKKQGYVHFNEKYLCVNNKINFDNISRNAKSVASQEENNIEVTVSQHDTNRDSIGEGVKLKSERIHVDGFVGAKSRLEALQLTIDGATHQDALQFAKYATINRHKGKLRCQHAKIKLLEGGEVHATKAEIESSLGGTIFAQDVILGHVKNNLKVYASNSITVKLISGEDNILHIGCQKIPILKSKVEYIQKDIEDLAYHLEEALRHTPEKVDSIKQKIAAFKDEIRSIKESYKNAFITIEQPLRGLNTIIFTIDEEQQIVYKTQEQSYSKFYLEIESNKITLQPVKKSIQIEE
ncbi:MAG: DUF342 domain-containing protein [Campylobacterales bacterium]|nr:DUF342 domain-containing protein [Campylobacterales bacterium]